jgi:large subunit ribosomal protein L29
MMKATQIRELTADEITTRIAELERERFNLRFRGATQTLDDPLRLRVIRRDIARLKTVLREQATTATKEKKEKEEQKEKKEGKGAGAAGKGR